MKTRNSSLSLSPSVSSLPPRARSVPGAPVGEKSGRPCRQQRRTGSGGERPQGGGLSLQRGNPHVASVPRFRRLPR